MSVAVVLVVACGGRSERADGDDEGTSGSGGTAGTGGTSGSAGTSDTGGTGGVAGTSDMGGTSGASGSAGTDGGCTLNGVYHPPGESFPSPDGCNTCFCQAGMIGCTTRACPPDSRCDLVRSWYAETLQAAKACEPMFEFQCEILVSSSIPCGCPTYVGNPPAIDELLALEREWNELGCGPDVLCEPCPAGPIGAYCSDEGDCIDVY